MPLNIEVRKTDAIARRFILEGDLDTDTAPAFQKIINEEVTPDIKAVVLDLEELDFLSSAGLQIIFRLKKSMKQQGGTVHLINLQPHIMKVFEVIKVLGSDGVGLGVFASTDEMDNYLANLQQKVKDQ